MQVFLIFGSSSVSVLPLSNAGQLEASEIFVFSREGTMLILSRKVGEKIVIGNGIEVVVQRISGDRVTLGLAAPEEVKILRGELLTKTSESTQPPSRKSSPPKSTISSFRERGQNPEPVAVTVRHRDDPRHTATGTFGLSCSR
jgi:carbon storage regulator